ncbi:hypothetical protein [Sinorhizobium sp. RAC02]|uniref:hypothetical protein n=1 Tax=Sinorhizobium sp. RAC02 TaxID=1842534 RepID=UPI00083DAABC|nr:hypothetical protein [Sinorhizobium sp. RAC02]AOF91718.1 hypothetical protein BSY16_3988 [Sinorhizobium sp. RAC02]
MTEFVTLKPGQWVLAFHQPYFYPGSDMAEWLERFTSDGGGWLGHKASETFAVHKVEKVMPKTYVAQAWWRSASKDEVCRYPRGTVIQAFATQAEAIALRDRFHAIGVKATGDIEKEATRLIQSYAAKREAKALKEVHACLPHIFGSAR